jgi:hypothetical protein
MKLGGYERDRRVFDWRLRRLVTHGVVLKLQTPALRAEPIYSISPTGSLLLQSSGECFVPLPSPRGPRDRELKVLHAVELNDLRLTLLRAGLEILWMAESEIRSRNELTPSGYAKDYDALVTVSLAGRSARFALEYERTLKSNHEYRAIAKLLEDERAVERVLYLLPNHDLLSFCGRILRACPAPGFLWEWPQAWHERASGHACSWIPVRDAARGCVKFFPSGFAFLLPLACLHLALTDPLVSRAMSAT